MLLIPGGPGGNHRLYADIEEDLFRFADLVIVDLRGCGYSDISDVRFCTLDNHIDDIVVVLAALGLSSPIIHGCSYGAFVALGCAIRYPHILKMLILSSGAASGKFIDAAKNNLLKVGTHEQINAANTLWEGKFEDPDQFSKFYKIMAPLYIYSYHDEEKPFLLKNGIPYNTDLVNFAFGHYLKEFDYRDLLSTITTPTLIFSGKQDWLIGPEQANTLHKGINGSILITLDKCGHFPWKDRREEFLKNIQGFILENLNNSAQLN